MQMQKVFNRHVYAAHARQAVKEATAVSRTRNIKLTHIEIGLWINEN